MQRVFRHRQLSYLPVTARSWERSRQYAAAPATRCDGGDRAVCRAVARYCREFKIDVDFLPGDGARRGTSSRSRTSCRADKAHKIKPLRGPMRPRPCVTHPRMSQDSRGSTIGAVGLLLVDTISGLGSLEYEHDAVGHRRRSPDQTVCAAAGSRVQTPFEKALAVAQRIRRLRSYWDWRKSSPSTRRDVAVHARDEPAVRIAAKWSRASGGRAGETFSRTRPLAPRTRGPPKYGASKRSAGRG
jgi:alanine-glyoxylate transaminase/serine-glyoxylate transaminase/serine-pyruvate transaminase